MPLHGYSTDRRPPTNVDHLYAHPYAFGICVFQIVAGALSLLMTLTNLNASQSVQRLPQSLIAVLGVLLLLGGTQIIRGLLNDDDDLMQGWKIERTGLILSAAAWFAYFVTVIFAFPASVMSWSLILLLGIAHCVRYRATVLQERRFRGIEPPPPLRVRLRHWWEARHNGKA